MADFRLVNINNKNTYKRVEKLYNSAFPADERAPFFLIKSRVKSGKAELLHIAEGNKWIGFTYILTLKELVYVFYLAIDDKYRGLGYGQKAVKAVLKRYKGKKVFLALEDFSEDADNKEERLRRHEFYKKCGLEDLPYRLQEATVIYALMGVGGAVYPYEYRELIDNWLGPVLKHFIMMRIIE
ncbi:MAG: GNAT family N-acetyltransferase [Lachnospiraceae bacterium]|nr:GNAT family N-acetyltransferase [Lachnospiraceae bacterium]